MAPDVDSYDQRLHPRLRESLPKSLREQSAPAVPKEASSNEIPFRFFRAAMRGTTKDIGDLKALVETPRVAVTTEGFVKKLGDCRLGRQRQIEVE